MDFLRDDGLPVGCYANRYVRVLAADGSETDKSFGLSWWRGLEDLGCHTRTGLLRALSVTMSML